MSTYVVRLTHTSDQCPTSNAKVRDRAASGAAEMPKIAADLGVTVIVGPLAVATEHESIVIVEAASDEVVHTLVKRTGLFQWNTVKVGFAESLQTVLDQLDSMPPPIY
jgi:hypothetical protein